MPAAPNICTVGPRLLCALSDDDGDHSTLGCRGGGAGIWYHRRICPRVHGMQCQRIDVVHTPDTQRLPAPLPRSPAGEAG